MQTYKYLIDAGDEPWIKNVEFDTDEQALAYGKDLFDNCTSPFVTVFDESGKKIGEFDGAAKY